MKEKDEFVDNSLFNDTYGLTQLPEEQFKIKKNQKLETDTKLHTHFNDITDSVKIYYGTEPSSRTLSRDQTFSKLPPLGTSPELDSENESLLKKFLEKGKLPDFDQRKQLIQHIQRLKVNSIVKLKYDKANYYQELIQDLINKLNENDIKEKNINKTQILEIKLKEVNEKIEHINLETK